MYFAAAPNKINQSFMSTAPASIPHAKRQLTCDVDAATKPALVLLSCGSFSPVHTQHLRNFEDARNALADEFNVVQGILSPVHDAFGKRGLVAAAHRIAMCELATADSDWLTVSRWECEQAAWSRTLVTLQAHHAEINRRAGNPSPPIQVRLLCGSDLLLSFLTPNVWIPEHVQSLLGVYGLVVIPRPGTDVQSLLEADAIRPHRANVLIAQQACDFPVSSSVIRTLLSARKSARYLMHDAVHGYCVAHRLWSAPNESESRSPSETAFQTAHL